MNYRTVTIRILSVWFALVLLGIIVVADMDMGVAVYGHLCNFRYFDKLGHFLLMGGMAFMINLSLDARRVSFCQQEWLVGSLAVMLFVLAEECTQIWMPHRQFQISDLLCDGLGILLFGRAASWLVDQRSRRLARLTPE
jgi:hypothetical protein